MVTGSSTLWLASTRHLMRWTFAPPAQWEIGSPPVAEVHLEGYGKQNPPEGFLDREESPRFQHGFFV